MEVWNLVYHPFSTISDLWYCKFWVGTFFTNNSKRESVVKSGPPLRLPVVEKKKKKLPDPANHTR